MITLEKTILDLSQPRPLTEIASSNPFVTSRSRWKSRRWTLDGLTPGYAPFSIKWWPEETTPELLDELKLLAAILFVGRPGETELKYSTGPGFAIAARYLAAFMAENSYFSLADLDLKAYAAFKGHLKRSAGSVATKLDDPVILGGDDEDAGEDDEADGPALGVAGDGRGLNGEADDPIEDSSHDHERGSDANAAGPRGGGRPRSASKDVDVDRRSRFFVQLRLSIWRHLHLCRAAMGRAGLELTLNDPCRDQSLSKQAKALAAASLNTMEDLPDEVVLPILHEAHRLIGEPAEQVIDMLEAYFDLGPRGGNRVSIGRARASLLAGQTFKIEGETQPWYSVDASRADPANTMMKLVRTIRSACVIALAAGIGWRISEASSVEVEDRNEFGPLPSCILTTQSYTRTSDHFWIRALLSKHRPEPTPDDWLIGARLSGTTTEPMTVRAVRVLERLYRPIRRTSDSLVLNRQLIVGWYGTGITFKPRNIMRVRAENLRIDAQEFIRERVGLRQRLEPLVGDNPRLAPYVESDGDCIRPHQWRRTFFRMMYRTDPNLLPAISRHFKHVSLAVTEDGYAPRDPDALEEAESVATAELVEVLFARGEGGPPPISGGDRMLERNRRLLASIIDGGTKEDAAPRLAQFASSRGIRLWPAEHGSCLIGLNPDKAACHTRGGRIDWRADRPNLLRRSPGLCCSCPNLVLTKSDAPFWERRYRANRAAWNGSGRDPAFRAARDRARQARTILEHLGAAPDDDWKEKSA